MMRRAGGAGGDEVGPQPVDDGAQEVVRLHIDERSSLCIPARDEVERDVDVAGFRDHVLDVTFHRALVQRVELGHLSRPAGRLDVLRNRVKLRARAADQKDARPLACKGPSDASAYPSAGAVDDSVLPSRSSVISASSASAPRMSALTTWVGARAGFSTCD